MRTFTLSCLSLVALFIVSCSSDQASQPAQTANTSFGRFQQKVLTPSCAISGCHIAGAQFASESGLILTSDVAYANLVGVLSKQTEAKEHGLLRVKAGDPDSSFLYMKVHGVSAEYGSKMPLGGTRLTVGQLEFLRQWIMKGALKTGDDIDPQLLEDTTLPPIEAFAPLAPPAPGKGYQLKIEPFDVDPSFERELFIYRKLNNPTPIYVNRIQTKMRPGSHHFVFYEFMPGTPKSVIPRYDEVRDIRFPDGTLDYSAIAPMQYHQYAGGTQMGGDVDYLFPPGVALALPANMSLDCNAHYVNRSSSPITGECYANLYTVDRSQVQHEAQTLRLGNYDFSLPAQTKTTITTLFPNEEAIPMNVIMLTSHAHERLERFIIRIKGGARNNEIVYESTSWEHPGVKYYDPPIVLQPGEALQSEVTYNNTTNHQIDFGLASTDEMDIIFGYYYY